METKKIKGLIVPVFTPMDEKGEVDYGVIGSYAAFLKEKKVTGVFVCGSSGEGMLLTNDERKKITEHWARHTGDNFKLIAHISATSYKDAGELARHAAECGVYAIASMGPVFCQPSKMEDLVGFCSKIASAVPSLPYYYYHIPVRSNVNFPMIGFLKMGEERIPNLTGIKYTHSNMMDMLQCIQYQSGKFDILHGPDEMFLSGLAIGVKGAVGTTFNFISSTFNKMIGHFKQGRMEEAAQLQHFVTQVINVISRHGGGIVAGKAIMELCGLPCGPCRSPLPSISKESMVIMEEELKSINFFEHV